MGADLRTVSGTMRLGEARPLVDPLAVLPEPPDDRTLFRTFPGAPDPGELTWREEGDHLVFSARLPKRYGAVGALPRDGLWGDGGWYPVPVEPDGAASVADWHACVTLPEGVPGVLNGVAGTGRLCWDGRADRLSIAAILGGRVTDLAVGGGVVRLVERNAPERSLRRLLPELVTEAWPPGAPVDLVIVEDLDLLRLARAAPRTVYLSERAFRLQPAFLQAYHVSAVRRAIAAAALQARPVFADTWTRDFAAQAFTDALPARSARKLLGWFAWNPVVDALLYDGTLPYFGDIFDEAFGAAPGPFETLGGRIPGGAAASQLDDLAGVGTAVNLATLQRDQGLPFDAAADEVGVPAALRDAWARPYRREQDYVAVVDVHGARVERRAPDNAPPEVVSVRVDGGAPQPWLVPEGPASLPLDGAPHSVEVDPAGHVAEDDLVNNRWPARWTVVFNGGFYNLTPSQHAFDVAADLYFRRRNDSRNLLVLGVEHDAQDLVSLDVGWLRWIGPLVDRRTRQHRLAAFVGPSLLDPAFRPTDDGAIALGGAASYVWDTRTDDTFALDGHRVGVGVSGGWVPGSDERWAGASVSAAKLLSPHPRHVVAGRVKGGWASGNVEHRLLPLGGGDDVRAVAEPAVVGNERISATFEYRFAPLRNASVPLPLLYGAELQLSPGIDAGIAWRGEERFAAVGVTGGVHVISEFLGAQPNLTGVTFAWPIWAEGFEADTLQIYIDFAHPF